MALLRNAAILPLYQALSKTKAIRNITVRHEEGATHAADGFARATGKVGVAIGTSGPAGTNMVTGLYTAWADSIPIITITGQAMRSQLHREGFQAVDIIAIVKPVVKQSFLALEPAQVQIDIPLDVQKAEIYYDPQTDRSLPIVRSTPNQAAVEKALDLLLAVKRPLILSGGGVINADASAALTAFAEYLQVPVALTLMGGKVGALITSGWFLPWAVWACAWQTQPRLRAPFGGRARRLQKNRCRCSSRFWSNARPTRRWAPVWIRSRNTRRCLTRRPLRRADV